MYHLLKSLSLTPYETAFMRSYLTIGVEPTDPFYTFATLSDVCADCGIGADIMRGVLGSLTKKGILMPDAYGDGANVIGLCDEYHYLVK